MSPCMVLNDAQVTKHCGEVGVVERLNCINWGRRLEVGQEETGVGSVWLAAVDKRCGNLPENCCRRERTIAEAAGMAQHL